MAKIRHYTAADEAQLIYLWESVFPDDPPHNAPAKVIAEKLQVDEMVFVSVHEGKLVGACMAGYDGHRGWLYAVAVLPEHRRDGIGRLLVQHAVDQLRQLGCGKVNLQIRAGNTAVASFYRSLGFEVEERMSMGMRL